MVFNIETLEIPASFALALNTGFVNVRQILEGSRTFSMNHTYIIMPCDRELDGHSLSLQGEV